MRKKVFPKKLPRNIDQKEARAKARELLSEVERLLVETKTLEVELYGERVVEPFIQARLHSVEMSAHENGKVCRDFAEGRQFSQEKMRWLVGLIEGWKDALEIIITELHSRRSLEGEGRLKRWY